MAALELRSCRVGVLHWKIAWANSDVALEKEEACSRDDHSRRGSRIGCMKQSDTERPSRYPSGVGVVEFCEDVFGVVSTVFRNGKDAYDNGKHTSKGPEDGKSLFSISDAFSSLVEGSHIKPWQPAVPKGRYQVAQECNAKEHQIDLPASTLEDTNTRFSLEDVDACTKEKRSGEVDGESDGNVSDYESPSTDPRCDSAVGRRRQHESLVVDTATSRVDTRDLSERSSHAENDERHSQPSPDDADRACTGDGVEKSGR